MDYNRIEATSLTLDELHRALEQAAIAKNVAIYFVADDDTVLREVPDDTIQITEHNEGDKDARTYLLVDGESFTIPDYYEIDRIDRVDAADENTVAVDAEFVYYVVNKDGTTIRIEI